MSHAQNAITPGPSVTPLTPTPTAVSFDGTSKTYTITGGERSGQNLFHSFRAFGVPANNVAYFSNTDGAATTNILGRVTGNARSDIYGTIHTITEFGNANLFLINPAGWLFGAGAALEVGGSFHVSTAHYISFPGTEQRFYADSGRPSVLSAANPVAFGFLGPSGSITVNAPFDFDLFVGMQVPEGQTLSLVGGDIAIVPDESGALPTLLAPGGRIQVGSFASVGEASVNGLQGNLFTSFGRVDMGLASIDTTGFVGGGGTVMIRGGQLVVDASFISSFTLGDVNGAPVGIDINMAESVTLVNESIVETGAGFGFGELGHGGAISIVAPDISIDRSTVRTSTLGNGDAGDVGLNGARISLTGGGVVTSTTAVGSGRGGDVTVSATERVFMMGGSRVETTADPDLLGGDGNAGNVFVSSGGSLALDRSFVRSFGFGAGRAGMVSLNADTISLVSAGVVSFAFANGGAAGVSVEGGAISITGGSGVGSLTQGAGDGGNVAITGTRSISVSGRDPVFGDASSVFTLTDGSTGKAGDVTVSGASLTLDNSGTITSTVTLPSPDPSNPSGPIDGGGNIMVNVDQLRILGGGSIESQRSNTTVGGNVFVTVTETGLISGLASNGVTPSGIFSVTCAGCANPAADITVQAGNLTLTGGAAIQSGFGSQAQGGSITVSANSLVVSAGGGISTRANTQDVGQIMVSAGDLTVDDGFINATTIGAGDAGDIVLSAQKVNLIRGGQITSGSAEQATGDGGNITIGANAVSISGSALDGAPSNPFSTDPRSGIFTTASSSALNAGAAGQITVNTSTLTVTSGGTIDSSTTGAGAGGAITVNASNQVDITDGGSIRADSTGSGFTGKIIVTAGDRIVMTDGSISTRAASSDGGDIELRAPNIIRLTNSQITTSVEGDDGGGGNIFVDPEFVILQGSTISANAFGGPGGSVTIVANNFVADPASSVTASSALSTPGTVQIQSPDNNLASDIAQLPSAPIDASRLMQGSCSARRASAPSSFQVAGRGGVPADPDGYLPSFGASGAPFAPQASQTPRLALAMAGWDCWR